MSVTWSVPSCPRLFWCLTRPAWCTHNALRSLESLVSSAYLALVWSPGSWWPSIWWPLQRITWVSWWQETVITWELLAKLSSCSISHTPAGSSDQGNFVKQEIHCVGLCLKSDGNGSQLRKCAVNMYGSYVWNCIPWHMPALSCTCTLSPWL